MSGCISLLCYIVIHPTQACPTSHNSACPGEDQGLQRVNRWVKDENGHFFLGSSGKALKREAADGGLRTQIWHRSSSGKEGAFEETEQQVECRAMWNNRASSGKCPETSARRTQGVAGVAGDTGQVGKVMFWRMLSNIRVIFVWQRVRQWRRGDIFESYFKVCLTSGCKM